jgi:hypothetical protein
MSKKRAVTKFVKTASNRFVELKWEIQHNEITILNYELEPNQR